MNLIMSIKPEFVEKIISSEKKYEFRKTIFRKEIQRIYIYSTYPEKKIIGYFNVGDLIKDTPSNLWNKFSEYGGISKTAFFNYFSNKKEGYAIEITNLNVFSKPIDTNKLDNFRAPQSFCYINKDL